MNTSAIVVLRHACDGGTTPEGKTIPFNKNITINNHGNHTVVNDSGIVIPINWLGQLGLKQTIDLGTALQTVLNGYCPVSRIITEDTGTGHDNDGTSNPLHTISTYANTIAAHQKLQFDIYNGGLTPDPKLFNTTSLLKDGIGQFSTVICWEAQGMWREGSNTPYTEKSILGLLGNSGPNGGKVNNYELIENNTPYKGQIIYVFECSNTDHSLSLKVLNYDGTKPEASQLQEIKSSSEWPTNLCPKCEQHDVSECHKNS